MYIFWYGASPFGKLNLANNFQDGGWHDCKNRGQDFDRNDVAMKAEPSYKKLSKMFANVSRWEILPCCCYLYIFLFRVYSLCALFKYQYFRNCVVLKLKLCIILWVSYSCWQHIKCIYFLCQFLKVWRKLNWHILYLYTLTIWIVNTSVFETKYRPLSIIQWYRPNILPRILASDIQPLSKQPKPSTSPQIFQLAANNDILSFQICYNHLPTRIWLLNLYSDLYLFH